MKERKYENNGIDGIPFFTQCIDEFEEFDLKLYLSELDDKSEKRVFKLANFLIDNLAKGTKTLGYDNINTGELTSAIKIFGARVIQATMIQYNETEKEDLR